MKTRIKVPEEYKPLLEDIRNLTRDPDNPNQTTKEQRIAIWNSLQEFGWVYPIIVDDDGIVGDGEQRIETLLEHDEYYAPVLRLNELKGEKRRLLRQVLNKLRGSHNEALDKQEIQVILDSGLDAELELLMGWDKTTMQYVEELTQAFSLDDIKEPEETKRTITLNFEEEDFNKVVNWFADQMRKYNLKKREAVILKLVDET